MTQHYFQSETQRYSGWRNIAEEEKCLDGFQMELEVDWTVGTADGGSVGSERYDNNR